MQRFHGPLLMLSLLLLMCIGRLLNPAPQEQAEGERKIPIAKAESWMLESLPGIGPVTAKKIKAQVQQGEDIKWPKRAKEYALGLFDLD